MALQSEVSPLLRRRTAHGEPRADHRSVEGGAGAPAPRQYPAGDLHRRRTPAFGQIWWNWWRLPSGFVTRLNTNGRLLTPELCRRLYEASLDSVQVTLYSADAAVHNTLVGAPGFDDTVQGIPQRCGGGPDDVGEHAAVRLNRDYAATLRFVHELGVRYVTCSGLIPSGGAETEASQATRLTQEELTAVLRQAVETAEELGMEIDFTSPGWLPEETLRGLGLHLIPSCGACLSNMAVTPDGQVVPCQSWLGGTTLGNLLTDDWSAIWDGETCRAIRAKSAKLEHICQLGEGNREGC